MQWIKPNSNIAHSQGFWLCHYQGLIDSSPPFILPSTFVLLSLLNIEYAHSEGATIFPSHLELMKLSDTLITLILPPSNYQYYSRGAYGFFILIGRMLKFMLDEDPATTKNSPIVWRTIAASVVDVTANGFDLLTAILKNLILHLGAIGSLSRCLINWSFWTAKMCINFCRKLKMTTKPYSYPSFVHLQMHYSLKLWIRFFAALNTNHIWFRSRQNMLSISEFTQSMQNIMVIMMWIQV